MWQQLQQNRHLFWDNIAPVPLRSPKPALWSSAGSHGEATQQTGGVGEAVAGWDLPPWPREEAGQAAPCVAYSGAPAQGWVERGEGLGGAVFVGPEQPRGELLRPAQSGGGDILQQLQQQVECAQRLAPQDMQPATGEG